MSDDSSMSGTESNQNPYYTDGDDASSISSRASQINPNDPDEQTQNSSESEPETQDEISSNDSDDDKWSASDSEEILTSNYSETSGSNDPSYSTASDTNSESSEIDSSFAHEKYQRNLVKNLLLAGHRGPQILKILKEEHGIKISACSNLSQKQKQWGL
ncbi:hypothetical protein PtB15_12B531 [Puccinia triticina]|nr:hypothetical protein PtB15_12B531 [Puccinia triticina]